MSGMSLLGGNFLPIISSLLFPVLNQKYTDQQKKEYEQRRQIKYTAYLQEKEQSIRREAQRERDILNYNYPDMRTVLRYPFTGLHLWERRSVDDDFMDVRLGAGRIPMRAKIEHPLRRFELDEDHLEEQMFALVETPVFLEGAPIVASLVKNFVCGIRGESNAVLQLVQSLMVQVAVLHSYDEVKIILLIDSARLEDRFAYTKILPHLWDNQQSIRFIATNESEAYQIGTYLREQLGDDLRNPRDLSEIVKERPYYCVLALDKQIFGGMEVLKEIMQLNSNCGVSVITAFVDLMKDSMLLLEASNRNGGKVSYLNEIERDDDMLVFDRFDEDEVDRCLRKVANITIRHINQSKQLPTVLTFMDMMRAGSIEQLAPLRRWQQSDPVKTLAVPVGVTPDGMLAMLDLHERVHGPHGLVAGMTGSGKSEFLLTYVLSIALHFHPDEVAFVLIDYKGGGLAGAFVDKDKGIHLPHVVGTITNLDGSAIQRSLTSLQAEVNRRQRVFNEAKSIANEGTMDIYAYQKLYRRGIVAKPVPHLIIVSDEFAELKQQQPEFMEQLVSIARIGRSLGVHLILATQKPAGVVSEQIWSNAKFKACLKVQGRQDSMDMLRRPEAAELKEVGRYYLQIGYNESFSIGQSAWSGAPYAPVDEFVMREDQSVQFVDMLGQVIHEGRPQPPRGQTGETQLVAIVEELCRASKEAGIAPRMLWKEPLSERIDLDVLVPKDGMAPANSPIEVPLGLLDDPMNQRQFPFVLPIQHGHNTLIAGEPDSGKTTLVQSMLLGLARRYSPDRVNFYVLDYSGGALMPLAHLPHCGALLTEDDEDSLESLFELINNIIEDRKKLFRELQVGNFEAAIQKRTIPLVMVVIDGVAAFLSSKKGETYGFQLPYSIKAGLNYGVRYCITCGHSNEVSSLVRQNFGTRMSLVQMDKYAHSDVLGCRCDYVPPALPGRGLVLHEDCVLEIQVPRFAPEVAESDYLPVLTDEAMRLAKRYEAMPVAKGIAIIPKDELYESFARRFADERIPLGYTIKGARPIALPLRQFSFLSLYFGNPKSKEPVLSNMLFAARRERMSVRVVTASHSSFVEDGALSGQVNTGEKLVACTADDVYDFFHNDLFGLVSAQREVLRTYCESQGIEASKTSISTEGFRHLRDSTKPALVIFESFGDILRSLEGEDNRAKREAVNILAKGIFEAAYNLNVYFIGCFGPNDPSSLYTSQLYQSFNKGNIHLLFGGKYDTQKLVDVPWNLRGVNKEGLFNVFLMDYRGGCHFLTMPCRQLNDEDTDDDERSIFD